MGIPLQRKRYDVADCLLDGVKIEGLGRGV
jgi:hypothetical protein